jgi:serine/threonine protein kinase
MFLGNIPGPSMLPTPAGRFQILRKLATGGMAEIFLARQTGMEGLERLVVIKRILPHRARDAEFVTMFLDEARIVAGLNHPNVAQIYDLGKEEETFFLVMEYVRGPDLGKLLDTIYESGGRGLPLRIALPIIIGTCEALHYIHEKRDEAGMPLGIVHRDINPQNVVVSYEGAVKLIDFGIAKAKTKVYETRTGVIKGTYGYMAPEQLTRKAPIDRRSDVFALGVLLYESILGVHPFEASDEIALLGHIVRGDYKRPRAVRADFPEELERVILGCLTPRPEQRIPDARTVQEHLEEFMAANRLVVSMARLGDFVREVVPEPAEKRDDKPRSAPRARVQIDGPTPQHLRFPDDGDSVIAALSGGQADATVSRLETPLFPDDEEATAYQGPRRGKPRPAPPERRSPSERRPPPPVTPAPVVPVASPSPTAHGYAIAGLLAPEPLLPTPSPLQPLLEPSGTMALDAIAAEGPTTMRTEDSVSVATVMDRPVATSKITLPPVSNIDRLGAIDLSPRPQGPWSSPTVRGIALVLLAAVGGAVLAAVGVAVLSDDSEATPAPDAAVSVAVAEPVPPVTRTPGAGSQPIAAPPPVAPTPPTEPPTEPLPTPVSLPTPAPPPSPPAPAAPGGKTLQIRSTPEGARIWINGAELERRTPATIDLPVDTPEYVTVKVSLERYQSMEREVEVITGAAVFELQAQRPRIRRRAPPRPSKPPRRSR